MAKTGRKQKPHVCPWDGKSIDGLYHCHDGRWRNVATGERWTQPDPKLAVAHYLRSEARRNGSNASVVLPLHPDDDADADDAGAVDFLARKMLGPGEHHAPHDESLVLRIPDDPDEQMTLIRNIPVEALASFFKTELIERPKLWAGLTGIEQLGYWADLPKPVSSPTLKEVGEYFLAKKKLSADWRWKSEAYWDEFVEYMEVTTLREVTQEKILDYADAIIDAPYGPTYSRQRFAAIKAIINYPPKRAKWTDDCKRAYGYCAVMIPNKKSNPDPHPIDARDFNKLLASADAQMKAVLLTMMNFCMYGGEAAMLDWDEIDWTTNTLATHREKTGEVRIGVLWPRTVEAIKALPRLTNAIFLNDEIGSKHNYLSIYRLFKKLRKAVKLPGVQLSHIRDGAYTSAIAAKIPVNEVKLIAGHATGISDQYLLRQPMMVEDACMAIERAYFGTP